VRIVVKLALAASGLLVIGGCGSAGTVASSAAAPATPTAVASALASPSESASPAPAQTAAPKVKKRTITERRSIPFRTRRVSDPALAKGKTRVTSHGARGVRIVVFRVTLTGGVQTGKRLVRKEIVRAPVTRVIAVGTKQAQQCDPNYAGACVPISSDVDCAGGSGNGPAYVQGPVRVVGTDIYGLDADGNGIGCDS
jgi:hypothetical protein